MLVYYQWRPLVDEMILGVTAAGQEAILFTPHGPPGAFALYQLPEMTLGPTFLNEFVCVSSISPTPFRAQQLTFVTSLSLSPL